MPFLFSLIDTNSSRFHFADYTAIERFDAATDRYHNKRIEKLVLTIHSARNEVPYRWEQVLNETKALRLAKHFPNLKHVVIKVRGQYELLSGEDLDNFCTTIRKKLQACQALEWIHVNGLIDPGAIMKFAPAIRMPKNSNSSAREVQTDVTTCW